MKTGDFEKLFSTADTPIKEAIASKLYRHGFGNVGKEIQDEIKKWLKDCGFIWREVESSSLQIKIYLLNYED